MGLDRRISMDDPTKEAGGDSWVFAGSFRRAATSWWSAAGDSDRISPARYGGRHQAVSRSSADEVRRVGSAAHPASPHGRCGTNGDGKRPSV